MYKFGLIGYPLSHSMSKVIQEAAFKSIGAEGTYDILETEQEDLIDRIKYLRAYGAERHRPSHLLRHIGHRHHHLLYKGGYSPFCRTRGSIG